MTRTLRFDDVFVSIRDERKSQDRAIAEEVIVHDCYRLRTLRACRKRMDVIVDIGGHVGCFGLFAKSLWPEATLIALEPNPESAELYRESLDANGFDDDIVLQAALGYSPERCVLVGDGRSTGGCLLVDPEEAMRLSQVPVRAAKERYSVIAGDVPVLTFEELLSRFQLERVDLMKVDCEGSEMDLCRHVSVSHSLKVSVLLGEYHVRGGYDRFSKDAQRAFPHLYFFGDSPSDIGPFWGLPSLRFAARFFLSHHLRRARRVMRRSIEPGERFREGRQVVRARRVTSSNAWD